MIEVSVRGGRVGFAGSVEEGLGVDADGFGALGRVVALGCGGVVRVVVDDGGWLEVVDGPDEDVGAAPRPVGWLSGVVQPTSATEHTAAAPATLRSRLMTLM